MGMCSSEGVEILAATVVHLGVCERDGLDGKRFLGGCEVRSHGCFEDGNVQSRPEQLPA